MVFVGPRTVVHKVWGAAWGTGSGIAGQSIAVGFEAVTRASISAAFGTAVGVVVSVEVDFGAGSRSSTGACWAFLPFVVVVAFLATFFRAWVLVVIAVFIIFEALEAAALAASLGVGSTVWCVDFCYKC
jgi:hypothetical protein